MLRFTFKDARTDEFLLEMQYDGNVRVTSRMFKNVLLSLDLCMNNAESHSVSVVCQRITDSKEEYLFNIFAFDYEGYLAGPDDEFYPDRCIYRLVTVKAFSSPTAYQKRTVVAC